MGSSYVTLKLTRTEAEAFRKMGRHLMDDEYLSVEIFNNNIESSAAWSALRKLTEAIANENPRPKKKKK